MAIDVINTNNFYKNKNILVTGARGFIGSFLVNKLLEIGSNVSAVFRQNNPHSSNTDINWFHGDLSDANFVDSLFKKAQPEVVFHLASEVVGSRDSSLVIPTFKGNFESTLNILVSANNNKNTCKKIVLTGSLEEPDESDMSAIPSSPYAAAKWAGSAYARMFHSLYDTPTVLARLFMVYGPAQRDLRKFIPYIILSILNNKRPELSNGTRMIDWIFVEDVVQGFLDIACSPGIEGKQIEIGSGHLVSTRELAEKICEIMDTNIVPDFGAIAERPMEQVRKANVKETFRMTGWKPSYKLEQGLKVTIDWYTDKFNKGELEI